jgi:hypothetical protein
MARTREPGSGSDRGTVTAELAVALPSMTLLLALVLAVGSSVVGQVRCLDAARAGARAAARGEAAGEVSAVALRVAPEGATVTMNRSGDEVVVDVVASLDTVLPGVRFTARSRATAEVERT